MPVHSRKYFVKTMANTEYRLKIPLYTQCAMYMAFIRGGKTKTDSLMRTKNKMNKKTEIAANTRFHTCKTW